MVMSSILHTAYFTQCIKLTSKTVFSQLGDAMGAKYMHYFSAMRRSAWTLLSGWGDWGVGAGHQPFEPGISGATSPKMCPSREAQQLL